MKQIIKNIIISIIIILPLPITILWFYEINNLNYIVNVDENNISTIQNYLDKNNIKVDENLKKIVLNSKIFSYELNIIYENNENKKIYFERQKFDKQFADYLVENNINHRTQIIGISLIISIIISGNQIAKLHKNEIIY